MRFGFYLPVLAAMIFQSQSSTALHLTMEEEPAMLSDQDISVNNMVQTDTEMVDMIEPICKIVNLLIDGLLPKEPRQKKRIATQAINAIDANKKTTETGGQYGCKTECEKTPSEATGPSVLGLPTDMKTFFGGNFFSQLKSEVGAKWKNFLP